MKNMDEIIEEMNLEASLSLGEIPDLNLYMDQVIQLFEKKFSGTKRTDDEKVLTKTMINNYAKGKLFFPIKNKKYSKDHLMLISMIYQMKGALSINDVKMTLEQLNSRMIDGDFDLSRLYSSQLHLTELNRERFKESVQGHGEEVSKEVSKLNDQDEEYLEQLLMVAAMSEMSNFYRRAAERIVDEIAENNKG
ncbi:DUF1836 domain-containing protein [Virgibacillus kekensis]|uniref:DUF1836 domain-containing protein n=1 Tax=Virgibacillus kekensis TaxID=202261 RepID=A0ABV9DL34_9BACI